MFMTFSISSDGRLTERDLERFATDSLFDRLGRAVCRAGCLPRKELYEAWEMARRVRRRMRGGRIVDLAAAHGLLGDLVVSSHACGALADVVLERAAAARARVAVLPYCHDFAVNDGGALPGWMDRSLAIDVMRAVRLEGHGYRVWTQTVPAAITPKNRLLLGEPDRPR
jgi:hypothetical protein